MMVRPPALAGSFYSGDPLTLMGEVDQHLNQAKELVSANLSPQSLCPKILVIPHAGHVYSGLVASLAYARIAHHRHQISRIVMLCPAHREYFCGVALPNCKSFATPLGTISIDQLGIKAISDVSFIQMNDLAHQYEHALEVHLPFLQRLWKDQLNEVIPEILPLIVGDVSAQQVSNLIERLWGNEQTLILVSSDLSHFMQYEEAKQIDIQTCQKVLLMHSDISHAQACGATPLNAALFQARSRNLTIEQLGYCNSGDTAGNHPEGRERVVGYASFALYESLNKDRTGFPSSVYLDEVQGKALVDLARASLHHATGAVPIAAPQLNDWMNTPGASFVTLSEQGRLRGCIGSLIAQRSIIEDVIANATSAALRDPRFPPVTASEAPELNIEVSVLSPPRQLIFQNEAHALWQLEPFKDGVIFMCEDMGVQYQSTFLPMVWEQFPNPEEFMSQLKNKAGLKVDFWSSQVKIYTYQVQVFGKRHA